MTAVVGACPCAISLDHFDFRLFMLAHIVKMRMNLLSVLFLDGSSSFYFSRKLFGFGAYAVLLIIWSAVMEYWPYFRVQFLFQ